MAAPSYPIWHHGDYQSLLKSKFQERCARNRGYSLRAFARDLNMTVSGLSLVFSGKRGLSVQRAIQIAARLSLSVAESSYFVDLVESQTSKDLARRGAALKRLRSIRKRGEFKVLELDYFRMIEDWYHSVIFALTLCQDLKPDAKQVAAKIGVPESVAQEAVERLLRLRIVKISRGRIVPTDNAIRIGAEIPSESIQKFHSQFLEKAAVALKRDPLERREFSSNVIPIDPQRIPEAKKAIREFALSFIERFGMGDEGERSRVYGLSVQFFDLLETEKSIC